MEYGQLLGHKHNLVQIRPTRNLKPRVIDGPYATVDLYTTQDNLRLDKSNSALVSGTSGSSLLISTLRGHTKLEVSSVTLITDQRLGQVRGSGSRLGKATVQTPEAVSSYPVSGPYRQNMHSTPMAGAAGIP